MTTKKELLVALSLMLSPFIGLGQVFTTDVIVQGSICVGFDCVSGESFGFDTQRLKENNLRIHFDDTSNSAGFPDNDWRIAINDTGNGGNNYFGIDDATAGTRPFVIEAGSGNNALVVEEGAGDVGLGTAEPVVELHIADGDSPTLRLEQNGASGWTPQTWDVAGNETNFFVRDVTNGSKIPFKIRPGATDNSLYINPDGNVSINSATSVEKLYVNGNIAGEGDYIFRRNNINSFKFHYDPIEATLNIREAQTDANIVVIEEDGQANSLYLHESGSISIGSDVENRKLYINGGLTVNGDIYCLSDRKIKKNISNIKYGLSEVLQLSAKQYDFDTKNTQELNLSEGLQLGLIAQEVENIIPEVVTNDINTKGDNDGDTTLKGVNYTGLIPVLIQAIQEQQEMIEAKDQELDIVKTQLAELSKKVDQLLTNTSKSSNLSTSSRSMYQDDPSATPLKGTTIKEQLEQSDQPLNNGRSNGN